MSEIHFPNTTGNEGLVSYSNCANPNRNIDLDAVRSFLGRFAGISAINHDDDGGENHKTKGFLFEATLVNQVIQGLEAVDPDLNDLEVYIGIGINDDNEHTTVVTGVQKSCNEDQQVEGRSFVGDMSIDYCQPCPPKCPI